LKFSVLTEIKRLNERLGQALCKGQFMNVARRITMPTAKKKDSSHQFAYMVLKKNQMAFIHPQCGVIFSEKPTPEYVVYSELVQTTRVFMRIVCGIKYDWVADDLAKTALVDLSRLIGRDMKGVLAAAMTEGDTKEEQNKRPVEDLNLREKFARKNTDESIDAAKKRFELRKLSRPANRQ